MTTINKLRTFFSLDMKTMLLFLETLLFLGWARLMVLLPFSMIAPRLGQHGDETSTDASKNKEQLKKIANAIQIMGNHVFWECKCLVRAIAGLKMLKRRGIECTLYLGTSRDDTGKMIAHAWLRSGPFYISGAEEMHRFTVVGIFANKVIKERKKGSNA